jgi:hypothetical protein
MTADEQDPMDDGIRVVRRPRWPSLRTARASGALIGAALLVAACGGGPSSAAGSPDAGGSTSSRSAVGYSACMRFHGVPSFPDPDSKGMPRQSDPQQLGVSSSQYQAAEQTCQHLLPTGGSLQQQTQQCLLFGDCPQTLMQQILNVERPFARCLRSHGVSNWPDPTVSAKGGRPVFDLSDAGIDPQSADTPQFRAKEDDCQRQVGITVPALPTT